MKTLKKRRTFFLIFLILIAQGGIFYLLSHRYKDVANEVKESRKLVLL